MTKINALKRLVVRAFYKSYKRIPVVILIVGILLISTCETCHFKSTPCPNVEYVTQEGGNPERCSYYSPDGNRPIGLRNVDYVDDRPNDCPEGIKKYFKVVFKGAGGVDYLPINELCQFKAQYKECTGRSLPIRRQSFMCKYFKILCD